MPSARFTLGAVAVLLTVGCATNREPSGPHVGREPAQREVLVENWTSSDLRVFVFYGGDESYLGTIRGMGRNVMRIPSAAGGSIVLFTRPFGAGEGETHHISETITVFIGQRVVWRLRATGGSEVSHGPR